MRKKTDKRAKPTAFEKRQRAEVMDDGPKFVTSIVALAAALGVTRQTIYNYKELPGFPKASSNGKYRVADARAFLASQSVIPAAGENLTELERQQIRRVKAVADRLELELAVKRGEYLHIDDVRAQAADVGHKIRRALMTLPGGIAPLVCGVSVDEATRIIRDRVELMMRRVEGGDWATPKEARDDAE